jgi:UDP-N-acetylglucosamine 2-epimerase (non-hydrolysing)/GDP/UDP-N,N'-diacetylbacillosamine 2-epimerase (hydrolysing)
MARRICVVTGSRAEYGLLAPVLAALKSDEDFEVQLIASGMHLAPEFGLTYRQIEADGYRIDAKVEMLLASDSPAGVAKSLGLGVIGFADALERLRPEVLLLAGDRFETLAAAQAALILRIPIAHLFGGETTEGAFDEAIRHAITKMSHLHLVQHREAAQRVCQLGENPHAVVVVGSPALDALRQTSLLTRAETERRLNFQFRTNNLLVTFHPVTLEDRGGLSELQELLTALGELGDSFGLIITRPNADPFGREVAQALDVFAAQVQNAILQTSLGQQLYWSAMAQVDAVVGNSSSGLIEAPALGKPTVDIGQRQRGRLAPLSVIHSEAKASDIAAAVQSALAMDVSAVPHPYGDGHAVERILEALKRPISRDIVQKRFHAVGC